MTNEQSNELEQAVEKAVEASVAQFPPRHATQTLTNQWEVLSRYETELKNRVRRERMAIVAEYNRLATETHADFDRREDDAITELKAGRTKALRTLLNNMEAKLREHDLLAQRMGDR